MTMTSYGNPSQTEGDRQQLWNTSQQAFEELRSKITEAAKAAVRYGQLARPVQNPAELLMIVDQALEATTLGVINRVEPNSGRIRQRGWQQQRALQQLQQRGGVAAMPGFAGLANTGGGGGESFNNGGLTRSQRRQIQHIARQTILQAATGGVPVGGGVPSV